MTIDEQFYEISKRMEWFINGYFILCIPSSMWPSLSTERIVELYNVEMEYFRPKKKIKMDNNEITAEWARKTAENQISIEAEKQLNKCLDAIKKAVSENKMSVNVYIYAKPFCLNELTKRGFKAKVYDDQREGQWTTISW